MSNSILVKSGAATKSRTRDLLITNQLLYQLSYAGYISWGGAVPELLAAHYSLLQADRQGKRVKTGVHAYQ